MYVPINFYHGGALLVQRAKGKSGGPPDPEIQGGGIHPPLSLPCMAQMSPYEGLNQDMDHVIMPYILSSSYSEKTDLLLSD